MLGWATAAWAASRRAFSRTRWRPWNSLHGYGLRYDTAFQQTIVDGWQKENPDNWLRHGDPWGRALHERVETS